MSSDESGCASTPESSSSNGDDYASTTCVPDFVRMMLLNTDMDAVLLTEDGGLWDFPYFEYKRSIQHGSGVARCCRDYQEWLGILSKQTWFTATVELLGDMPLGSKKETGKFGNGKLLFIENQTENKIEDLDLPQDDYNYLQMTTTTEMFPSDPRYRPQWFRKARSFFLSTLSVNGADAIGPVSQEHVSSTSTLLRVRSNKGPYYLKSPALGGHETSISVELSSIFPRNTPEVLDVCTELNCFTMRGFTHFDLKEIECHRVIETLGHIHLESLRHLDRLCEIGCKVRNLQDLLRKVNEWADGKGFFYGCHQEVEELRQIVPIVTDMCRRLEEYNIPNTLVHGDMALSNATYAADDREEVILFDWEFACISHPFLDFHRLRKDATLEAVTSYLRLWDAYENGERALEAFHFAWKLGWILKMWSLSDVIESCDVAECSTLKSWVFKILRNLRNSYK